MKGLLHRLAAQANGTTVPVHSDVRLPFANVALREDGTAENSGFQESALPVGVTATRTGETDSVRMEPARDAQSRTYTTPPLARAPTNQKSTVAPELVIVPASPNRNAHQRPRDSATDDLAAATRTTRSQVHTRAGETAAASRRPAAADSPISQSNASAMREIPAAEPTLLLPAQPVTRSSGAASTAAQDIRSGASSNVSSRVSASEEPHEVHIHIGRIDVTAVHEAPAPRQRAAPAAPPMTLDNYIAKRGGT